MKVLIACEESQRVCIAFRERGHEAYSCDIQDCSGGHPEWHIKGDALEAIQGGTITTCDGVPHDIGKWDLLIAHPPCTYLSNVAARWEERAKGAVFFMRFLSANAERIAIENPVGFMSSAYRKPDQIIHPYMFAASAEDTENYVTKATCLWLFNLPKLQGNGLPKPNNAELYGRMPSGKARTWEDTYSCSGKVRSKTFSGIAEAMAAQWGGGARTNG